MPAAERAEGNEVRDEPRGPAARVGSNIQLEPTRRWRGDSQVNAITCSKSDAKSGLCYASLHLALDP